MAMSAERITGAALAIADVEGIEKLSMARVAGELGFTTMALYRHVAGKAELVDLVVDAAVGPAPRFAATPGGWRADLERWALACWARFARRPWLVGATARSARVMGPHELGWLEAGLAIVSAMGIDPADAHDAVLLVLGHVRSVAQFARAEGPGVSGWAGVTDDRARRHRDDYPALAASTVAGAMRRSDRERLDFGLRCILDGLDRLVRAR